MEKIRKEWLEFLRDQYPEGSRIKIREMKDPALTVRPGITGKLEHIDENGIFHTKLENGQMLALTIGLDSFSVLPPEPTTLKLYMPLTADMYSYTENETFPLTGRELCSYEDAIMAALVKYRTPEENERGIMHWYSECDSVDEKVRSAVFAVEERNGQLWGVAECRVVGTLTPDELYTLKEYISGQASDGWGEGFEQHEIRTDKGELYVHLWSFDNDWSIETENERFAPKIAEGLPEMCFSTLGVTGDLICIRRGETGYYLSEYSTPDKEQNVELADKFNKKLGVTMWQRQAMEVGSICGWDVPGANPAKHEGGLKHRVGGISM